MTLDETPSTSTQYQQEQTYDGLTFASVSKVVLEKDTAYVSITTFVYGTSSACYTALRLYLDSLRYLRLTRQCPTSIS